MSWALGMFVILALFIPGVLRRTITITRGAMFSTMVVSTTQSLCVLFGLFNNLVIYPFSVIVITSTYQENKDG